MMAWAITADEDISVGDGSRDKKKKKKKPPGFLENLEKPGIGRLWEMSVGILLVQAGNKLNGTWEGGVSAELPSPNGNVSKRRGIECGWEVTCENQKPSARGSPWGLLCPRASRWCSEPPRRAPFAKADGFGSARASLSCSGRRGRSPINTGTSGPCQQNKFPSFFVPE